MRLAGIELAARHQEVLARRSRRAGVFDSAGLDSLLDAVEEGQLAATQQFISLLTTNFTGFFRHPQQFDIAATHARSIANQARPVRLWSTAAATGEEPYSLAMMLIEVFGCDTPPVSILATDVDVAALGVARRGEYREAAVRALGPQRRECFFRQTGTAGHWNITATVRALVAFQVMNLTEIVWPIEGLFDVIFCRNVLMYLEACHRYAVLERITSLLASDGLLILDPAEYLGKAAHLFAGGAGGVFSAGGIARRGEFRNSAPLKVAT
jgi:chemotaxis protein methyltransferase CheR